jgi:hypothetical protein
MKRLRGYEERLKKYYRDPMRRAMDAGAYDELSDLLEEILNEV